jgi:LysM repeat protein
MKRIIKLTESDLVRIVKRVINEQPTLKDLGKLPNPPEDIKKAFKTGYYTVKSGDRFLDIAMTFGLTRDRMMAINRLTNTDIQFGQKLKVIDDKTK